MLTRRLVRLCCVFSYMCVGKHTAETTPCKGACLGELSTESTAVVFGRRRGARGDLQRLSNAARSSPLLRRTCLGLGSSVGVVSARSHPAHFSDPSDLSHHAFWLFSASVGL